MKTQRERAYERIVGRFQFQGRTGYTGRGYHNGAYCALGVVRRGDIAIDADEGLRLAAVHDEGLLAAQRAGLPGIEKFEGRICAVVDTPAYGHVMARLEAWSKEGA